jgi:hypothetical protein
MFEKLKQLSLSNCVWLLEEEVSRLRAENRALMNSLLGTADQSGGLRLFLQPLRRQERIGKASPLKG